MLSMRKMQMIQKIDAKTAIIHTVLEECIKAMEEAHESMFTQCWSNPVYNSQGKQIDVSAVNNLQSVARYSKAILTSHRGAPNV